MASHHEKIERISDLLRQAQAVLASVNALPAKRRPIDYFLPMLAANADNESITDADFRALVRRTLSSVLLPPERVVVMTNLGEGYQIGGVWFKGRGQGGISQVSLSGTERVVEWTYLTSDVPGLAFGAKQRPNARFCCDDSPDKRVELEK